MSQPPYPAYQIETLLALQYWEGLIAQPRHQEPGRLPRFGAKAYCQNDEDGILAEIFRRIGPGQRRFVEIGIEDGRQCNTLALLLQGWQGGWVEANPGRAARARELFQQFIAPGQLTVRQGFATPQNIDHLVGAEPLDLLSIDIDGNDYWLWQAAPQTPRVVVIEYNASWIPPLDVVMRRDDGFNWAEHGTNGAGASLAALTRLGAEKGYNLVGCSASGVNAFFVRAELCGDLFAAPYTAENHFEPPRYFLERLHQGHAAGLQPVVIGG